MIADAINDAFTDPDVTIACTFRPVDGGDDILNIRIMDAGGTQTVSRGSFRFETSNYSLWVRKSQLPDLKQGDLFFWGDQRRTIKDATLDETGQIWECNVS